MTAKTALAVRALLSRPVRVLSQRGMWLMRSDAIPVLMTLHPSALLRGPPEQRGAEYAAWLRDLAHAKSLPKDVSNGKDQEQERILVGVRGFEPPASTSRT